MKTFRQGLRITAVWTLAPILCVFTDPGANSVLADIWAWLWVIAMPILTFMCFKSPVLPLPLFARLLRFDNTSILRFPRQPRATF